MQKANLRAELERIVGQELGRELSARTIMFHQALADRVGITPTDMKCLDYVDRSGKVTAGDLARLTGLTTGAITAVIDRLEQAGLAVRERSNTDRRKVFVRLAESHKMDSMYAAYGQLAASMQKLASAYSSAELQAIKKFITECTELLSEVTRTVQGKPNADN